jgi:tripartite-type tricarboxylate transporter receptor subunit TctC
MLRNEMRYQASIMTIFAACCALFAGHGAAQTSDKWPARPIQLVVPFAPGGSNDVFARPLASKLSEMLGQPVVVENRAGAGSVIGANMVAKSKPDGHTLLFVSSSLATSAAVQNPPYDPYKDFSAVARVATAPFVILTRHGFPAKTVAELVQYAKANPGTINYGSAGLGDIAQLATELLSMTVGAKMTAINYKGIAPAQLDLVAGRIDLIITTVASIRGTPAAKLPMLAVTTAERVPELPNIPTVRESGIDYAVDIWWGVFAPSGLPEDIRTRLNEAVTKIIVQPEFSGFLKNGGAATAPSTPQELQSILSKDITRWRTTAEKAGIRQP